MDIKPITIRLVMKLVGGGFFALTFPTIILGKHQAANVSQPMFPNTYFVIIMLFPNDSEVQKDWTRK
jgi:hypothetical protein